MLKVLTTILLLILAQAAQARPVVVVDIPPTAAVVRSIVGDEAEVQVLLEEGRDAHQFSLSPRQVAALADADMVFGIGSIFTPEMVKAARNTRAADAPSYFYSDENADAAELADPHIWLSQARLLDMRAAFWDAWAEAGYTPANPRDFWTMDATGHIDFGEEYAKFEDQSAPLIASHAAFGYFEADNQITSFGALRDVNDQPLPPRQFAKVMDEIENEKIRCMILETSEHDENLETLASDNDLKIINFNILGWDIAAKSNFFATFFANLNESYARCN